MRITGRKYRFAEMLHRIYHISYSCSRVLLPVTVFSSVLLLSLAVMSAKSITAHLVCSSSIWLQLARATDNGRAQPRAQTTAHTNTCHLWTEVLVNYDTSKTASSEIRDGEQEKAQILSSY